MRHPTQLDPNSLQSRRERMMQRWDANGSAAVIDGPVALLVAFIAGLAVLIAVILAAAHVRERFTRLEATVARFQQCDSPARPGDKTIVTIRHDGLHLVVTCQPLVDWRSPERQ